MDYNGFDRYSWSDLYREELVFQVLEDERMIDITRMRFLQNCIGAGASNSNYYDHHFNAAGKDYDTLFKLLLPWSTGKSSKYSRDEAIAIWEKYTGEKFVPGGK